MQTNRPANPDTMGLICFCFSAAISIAVLVAYNIAEAIESAKRLEEAINHICSPEPFIVSEYLDRMEKAYCKVLQEAELNRDKEPIVLWIGLKGVKLVGDEVVWVDRYPKTSIEPGAGGAGGSAMPYTLPLIGAFQPMPFQYPVPFGYMNWAQSCNVYPSVLDQYTAQTCCVSNKLFGGTP